MAETINRIWESNTNPNSKKWAQSYYGRSSQLSFGSLVRSIRSEKGLTQLDLATGLEWKQGSSRISDLEQGIVLPDRELVETIASLFRLDQIARSELLLSEGFLPSNEDVKKLKSVHQPALNDTLYPGFFTDFGGRILAMNQPFVNLYGLAEAKSKIESDTPNFLELLFDPKFKMAQKLEPSYEEVSKKEVEIFCQKARHLGIGGNRWFELLLLRLNNLPSFKDQWNQANDLPPHILAQKQSFFGRGIYTFRGRGSSLRQFSVVEEQLTHEDVRISYIHYIPQAQSTQKAAA